MKYRHLCVFGATAVAVALSVSVLRPAASPQERPAVVIETTMAAPRWAQLERQLLADKSR